MTQSGSDAYPRLNTEAAYRVALASSSDDLREVRSMYLEAESRRREAAARYEAAMDRIERAMEIMSRIVRRDCGHGCGCVLCEIESALTMETKENTQ